MAVRGTDVSKLMEVAVANWAGHREEEVSELFDRLFVTRIAGMVYPEARELVKAHRQAGHTVVLASSATRYQLAPLARDLGVDNVLCSEVEIVKGYFSGFLDGDVLWGPAKARAVRQFASENGVDLERSFAYANGDEDVAFLETVGNPRPLNPQKGLARVANEPGWPASQLSGRGRPGVIDVVRTGRRADRSWRRRRVRRGDRAADRRSQAGGEHRGLDRAGPGAGARRRGAERHRSRAPLVAPAGGVHLQPPELDRRRRDRLARASRPHRRRQEGGLARPAVRADRLRRRRRLHRPLATAVQARAALEPAVDRLRNGTSIAIAPEGTRSPTPRLGPFKKGAFHLAMQAGVPIVPVVIRNAGDVMWRGSLVIRPGMIDVAVLEPISTDDWTAEEIGARAREIRERFVETVEHWPA